MVLEQRLRADGYSLESLAALNARHLSLIYRSDDWRCYHLDARFDAPVVAPGGYRIASEHRLIIEIPDNYLCRDAGGRFVKARIRRDRERIFHPNVFPSDGFICFDDQFCPAKSLADQVWSVTRLMQARLINHDSPADWEADWRFLQEGDKIIAQIKPVELRLPRGLPRIMFV